MTDQQPVTVSQYWPPNKEQIATAIRWVIATFGAGIAGYCVAWGFGSQDQVMQLLNNPYIQGAIVSGIAAAIPLIQSLFAKTEKKIVQAAESMPNVQKVITKPTEAGQALAASIPTENVVSAADVMVVPK